MYVSFPGYSLLARGCNTNLVVNNDKTLSNIEWDCTMKKIGFLQVSAGLVQWYGYLAFKESHRTVIDALPYDAKFPGDQGSIP